jgi:DNA invertase Pin-like site-specific DNA recombinase
MPRAKSNKPMGRPKFEVTEEVLENVKKYMAQGLTKDQCAGVLGISPSTFYILQEQYSEFSESIKRGQAEGIQ